MALRLLRDWIFYGAIACLSGGVLLLFNEHPGFVTWSWALREFSIMIFGSAGLPMLPMIFLFSGLLGLMASFTHDRRISLLMLPQAVVFVVVMAGIVRTIMAGQYPDGYTPHGGWIFIGYDQEIILLFAVGHTTEFIARLWKDRGDHGAE